MKHPYKKLEEKLWSLILHRRYHSTIPGGSGGKLHNTQQAAFNVVKGLKEKKKPKNWEVSAGFYQSQYNILTNGLQHELKFPSYEEEEGEEGRKKEEEEEEGPCKEEKETKEEE